MSRPALHPVSAGLTLAPQTQPNTPGKAEAVLGFSTDVDGMEGEAVVMGSGCSG